MFFLIRPIKFVLDHETDVPFSKESVLMMDIQWNILTYTGIYKKQHKSNLLMQKNGFYNLKKKKTQSEKCLVHDK